MMDPLWLAVLLVGGNVLGVAVVAIVAAVVMTRLSRHAGPRLGDVRHQMTAAQDELRRLSVSILALHEQLAQMAAGTRKVAETVAHLTGHAPAALGKKLGAQGAKARKDAARY